MDIKNIYFFDNYGYDLNLQWNKTHKVWEGNIYLPKVSVGLYANTNIYIMEKVGNEYVFPQGGDGDVITFKWDMSNKFVDEFFMFDFDDTYYGPNVYETSALQYTPNNGPEVNTLIVKRFEEYEVPLGGEDSDSESESVISTKPLPIHIAFSSPDKYDSTTFKRTLMVYYNSKKIAHLTFFAETVEEDERLKILNRNLGYKIKPSDTIIFKDSNINEPYPDYKLLNEKRKELMMEGHNIYPYIGSYKAIVNAIKFFGYENLNIVEYWRNVDYTSDNFGKIFMTSKYSLTNKETINVNGKQIPIPNNNYRKMNNISLVYTINHVTGKRDSLEIPIVEEDFKYTMEEVMIKLFALRRKLNEEFMPASSRIIEIIGEAVYFGLLRLMNIPYSASKDFDKKGKYVPSIKIFPSTDVFVPNETYISSNDSDSDVQFNDFEDYMNENMPEGFEYRTCYTNITDTRQFIEYIIEQGGTVDTIENPFYVNEDIPITNIEETSINTIMNDRVERNYTHDISPEYYEDYYNSISEGYTDEVEYEPNIDFERLHEALPSAKIILENTSFSEVRLGQLLDRFMDIDTDLTFGNLNIDYYGYDEIRWEVKFSDDQIDEDLRNIGVDYEFEHHTNNRIFDTDFRPMEGNQKIFVEVPYTGYYDVIMTFRNSTQTVTHIFKKVVKIEQFQPDIKGFYYDARELPENLQYDVSEYENFISDSSESDITASTNRYVDFIMSRISTMTTFATLERMRGLYEDSDSDSDSDDIIEGDQSMPIYGVGVNDDSDSDSENDYYEFISRPGPYGMNYENQPWVLYDNLNYDITTLKPNFKDARYIKNAVDVKPYTWFLLGFNETKITGVVNPVWKLTNLTTNETVEHKGRYFTLLLKKSGDYEVSVSFTDILGNKYSTSRVIVIVDENANYRLYERFKNDYDTMLELEDERNILLYSRFANLSTDAITRIDDEESESEDE